jgi:ABC-type sugar transport system substrate-binding protein
MALSDRLRSALLGGLILAVAVATATPAAAQKKTLFGGVLYARDSQYWQLIERGMRNAAETLNADVIIGLNNRQLATEAQVVEDMITRGVDGIAISILDKVASAAVLKRAKEKGIVVVEDGTHLDDKSVAAYAVGVDQRALSDAVAEKMRDYIREQLGGKAKVGLIVLPPMNPQSKDRNPMRILQGLDITVIAEVVANTPEGGATAMEQILQRDPDVQLVYAANAGSIAGAAVAARRLGAKAKIYGIDMAKELAEIMLEPNSNLMAISDQDAIRVGYLAAEAAIKGARKEMTGPREIFLPVKMYTQDKPDDIKAFIALIDSLKR